MATRHRFRQLFSQSWMQVGLMALVVILLRMHPVLLGKAPIFGDNFSLMVPGKLYTASWLKQGILPLWNPTIFAGIPWIGDINQSVLYPTTLLFMWLEPGWAVNVTVMAHLALSFAGAYVVGKRLHHHHLASLLTAVLWTLSTQVVGSVNNLSTLQSITWTPWLIWSGLKVGKGFKYQFIFAALLSMQILAGYPQHVLYGGLLAVIISFYFTWSEVESAKQIVPVVTKFIASWAIAGVMAFGLSALSWLPFYQMLQQSTRTLQSAEQATAGSLHPLDLIKIVAPYFFDHPTAGMKWGPHWNSMPNLAMYVTWLGLLLPVMLLSRKQWRRQDSFFLLVTSIFFLLSFGDNLPGLATIQHFMPILKFSRGPSIALLAATLAMAIWLGSIFAYIQESKSTLKKWWRWSGVGALIFLIGWLLITYRFDTWWQLLDQLLGQRLSQSVFHTLERDRVIAQIIVNQLLINAFLLTAALWAWFKNHWLLLLTILALEMTVNSQAHLFFAPVKNYGLWQEINKAHWTMPLLNPQTRWLVRNDNFPYTGLNSYWEALTVRAPFSDSYVKQTDVTTQSHLERFRVGATPDWNMIYQLPAITGYATLLPADFTAEWQPEVSSVAEQIGQPDLIQAQVSINALPEIKLNNLQLSKWAVGYYLVDNWFEVTEDLSNVNHVMSYQWWNVYQLPTLARFRFANDQPAELINFQETPNHLAFAINNEPTVPANTPDAVAQSQPFLIIADRYDAHWEAELNGQPVEIENYQGMRKIALQPGSNQLQLNYRPQLFYLGIKISLLTLISSLVALLLTTNISTRSHRLLNKP